MNNNKKTKRLKSDIIYNDRIAESFHKTHYYESMSDSISNYENIQKDKNLLSTYSKDNISDIFDECTEKGFTTIDNTWTILNRIYKKNVKLANENGPAPIHSNLLSILAKVPLLLLAYAQIKGNKGATTVAAQLSTKTMNDLDPEARNYINKVAKCPDGMSLEIFETTSELLLKGNYPWGASRRIYIPKPGTDKLRPITIPPFMDKVVQTALKMILETIYEPWFDQLNCSFGFRTNKGCHDAIYSLTRNQTKGMTLALEADIEGAYPNVKRDKLIALLNERIHDKKFLKLIEHRLNIETFDSSTGKHTEETKGIPQGGTDSPYLWNIYFHKFDTWVQQYLSEFQTNINNVKIKRIKTRKKTALKMNKRLTPEAGIVLKEIDRLNTIVKENRLNPNKQYLYNLYKKVRLLNHTRRKYPSFEYTTNPFKYTYVRYADDFIILINGSIIHCIQIKKAISEWLQTNLQATLSETKSLITDLRENPAHYLGFELQTFTSRKLKKKTQPIRLGKGKMGKKNVLTKVAGSEMNASPDRKRLINRFHMKGYCDRNGFPICVKWLSVLQSFTIVERFNTVIRGFCNYYTEFSYAPSLINRWVYILRFSCLKTLATKYNTSIRKICKKFAFSSKKHGKTISIPVNIKYNDQTYIKYWTLITYKQAKESALKCKRKDTIRRNFKLIETKKNLNIEYKNVKNGIPPLNDKDWLEKINWINIRTQANFDLPCAVCGSQEQVEMHHIKHVRKNKYTLIDNKLTYLKMMTLRNRKQIPVCHECHKEIHSGDYNGLPLNSFSIYRGTISAIKGNKLFDNRIINSENYIHKGFKDIYGSKTLVDKGWILIKSNNKTENDS